MQLATMGESNTFARARFRKVLDTSPAEETFPLYRSVLQPAVFPSTYRSVGTPAGNQLSAGLALSDPWGLFRCITMTVLPPTAVTELTICQSPNTLKVFGGTTGSRHGTFGGVVCE